jgi:hypothetical protein
MPSVPVKAIWAPSGDQAGSAPVAAQVGCSLPTLRKYTDVDNCGAAVVIVSGVEPKVDPDAKVVGVVARVVSVGPGEVVISADVFSSGVDRLMTVKIATPTVTAISAITGFPGLRTAVIG